MSQACYSSVSAMRDQGSLSAGTVGVCTSRDIGFPEIHRAHHTAPSLPAGHTSCENGLTLNFGDFFKYLSRTVCVASRIMASKMSPFWSQDLWTCHHTQYRDFPGGVKLGMTWVNQGVGGGQVITGPSNEGGRVGVREGRGCDAGCEGGGRATSQGCSAARSWRRPETVLPGAMGNSSSATPGFRTSDLQNRPRISVRCEATRWVVLVTAAPGNRHRVTEKLGFPLVW